ncbi:MAG TPA: acyl-CoA dehydrogenase family protein [Ilumatobacteraceae bacterium]|nr:acyl-CoA dehydrogenase family protein [Ilumatobacteraceae bacterium]
MQFELADHQGDLLDAVSTLLDRFAGPARCRQLGGASPRYDSELEEALGSAGFLDIASDPDGGPLDATLVGEAVAAAAGVLSYGASALVAPGIGVSGLTGPVAMTTASHRGPVRFAADARTLLVHEGERVRVVDVDPDRFDRVPSRFGYPFGDVTEIPDGGTVLDAGSGVRMLAWWRLALAVEAVGTMIAALALTVDHTRERKQFGRAIGSFQAVQHRLAELKVLSEGARWLVLETAWRGAPDDAAAIALTHTLSAARRVPADTHQLTGALGFASEYDLHLWTMRLPALSIEAGWLNRSVGTAR